MTKRRPFQRIRAEVTVRGVTHAVYDIDVDAADLLLDLAHDGAAVSRVDLLTEWKKGTTDIRDSSTAAKYAARDKGAVAANILTGALRTLERLGAIERVGQAPRHAVIVRDRALLEELVEAWERAEDARMAGQRD